MVTVGELAKRFDGVVRGDPNVEIRGVASLSSAGPQDISYLASKRYRAVLAETSAGAVILAPEDAGYVHTLEGPDDMPAHIKSALTATSLAIPVMAGRMMLGPWQGIYLVEHRARPHAREIVLHFAGSLSASTEAGA